MNDFYCLSCGNVYDAEGELCPCPRCGSTLVEPVPDDDEALDEDCQTPDDYFSVHTTLPSHEGE